MEFDGADASDCFGCSVSGGDLDDDGLDDFVLGAPFVGRTGSSAGAAYVFLGR